MEEKSTKIVLPKELQIQMLEFFLKTSIPRKKRERANLPSETKPDGSDKK